MKWLRVNVYISCATRSRSSPFGGRVYYGKTDFPLSAEGRAAAAALGGHLRGRIKFNALYTSGMTRAVETASLAVPGMAGTAVPELREVDLGDWDGRSYDEVRDQFREIYERRGARVRAHRAAGRRELRGDAAPHGAGL